MAISGSDSVPKTQVHLIQTRTINRNIDLYVEIFMSIQSIDKTRRSFLQGIAVVPAITIAGYQTSAQAGAHGIMLSVNDPTAKALGYVETSVVQGKNCANCSLYTGADGAAPGPCAIFPGKAVTAAGYCNSWIPKA